MHYNNCEIGSLCGKVSYAEVVMYDLGVINRFS